MSSVIIIVSHEGPFGECDMQEYVAVTGAASTTFLKQKIVKRVV
jgi:hypothetical protein